MLKGDLKKEIAAYKRRLQVLRERRATQGIETPPSVVIEIEDIEQKLKDLEAQLVREHHYAPDIGIKGWTGANLVALVSLLVSIIACLAAVAMVPEVRYFLRLEERPVLVASAPTDTPPILVITGTPTSEPTETATPEPTVTPTSPPISTPSPTPEPTATIDADPTVYDNFNNPAYNGSFNRNQWIIFNDEMGQVTQQHGVLRVLYESARQQNGVGLRAANYAGSIQVPTFFEAKLRMEEPRQEGWVYLFVGLDLSTSDFSDCTLAYGDSLNGWIGCGYVYQDDSSFRPDGWEADYGIWHTVRIEIDPDTMTFTYYINGLLFGSYTSPHAEVLRDAMFNLDIGVHAPSGRPLVGYIDDVRIGRIE